MVFGTLGHIDQLHRDGAFEFLGQGAGQAFQRALHGGMAGCFADFWWAAQHNHAATGQHGTRRIVEEVVNGIALRAVIHAGGIKHQCLDFFARVAFGTPAPCHQTCLVGDAHPLRHILVRHGLRAHGLEGGCKLHQQLRGAATAHQHAALDDRLTGLVALQGQGLWQPQSGCEAGPQGGIGKAKVRICHG